MDPADPYDAFLEKALVRWKETKQRLGVGLPFVDWVAPQPRSHLLCDEDELCKWVVEQYPELSPFEFVIEDAKLGTATVLYGGTTTGVNSRYIERRLEIELEDDLVWYTERVYFTIVRSEILCDEIQWEQIERRMPRWATR